MGDGKGTTESMSQYHLHFPAFHGLLRKCNEGLIAVRAWNLVWGGGLWASAGKETVSIQRMHSGERKVGVKIGKKWVQ